MVRALAACGRVIRRRLAAPLRHCSAQASSASSGKQLAADVAVYGGCAAFIAYSGLELYKLYTDFPEGCQVRVCGNCIAAFLSSTAPCATGRDGASEAFPTNAGVVWGRRVPGWGLGGCGPQRRCYVTAPCVVLLLPSQSGMWEGRVEEARMNVMIPVKGPAAEGEVHCAAIKDADGVWVVLVLEVHVLRTALSPPQLHALATGKATDLEAGAGPVAPEVPSGSTPVLVFDLMHNVWLNDSYVIGAETATAADEAKTKARVVVVPPSQQHSPETQTGAPPTGSTVQRAPAS